MRLNDALAPKGCQDRSSGWLADFTPCPRAAVLKQLLKCSELLNACDFEEFLTRISEVFAEFVLYFDA